jgi:hypothetical protein
VLPPQAVAVFDVQVDSINYVQRLPPTWSEIDFYRARRGRKPAWNEVPRFPCTDEFRLAEVRFKAGGKSYKATLSCIGGYIFDLAVTPGPRSVAFVRWDEPGEAALLGDPLRAPTGIKEAEVLPRAWQEFLRAHAGGPPDVWVWYDEVGAYRVARESGVYLVLAEGEGPQFVLQRVEPWAEELWYLPHYDGEPEPLKLTLEGLMGGGAERAV